MEKIKSYNTIVNERLGISTPSIKWCDIIVNHILELISNSKNISEEVIINSKEIVDNISLEEYKKFPVNSIELDLNFKKIKSIDKIYVSGGAYPFGHKNWKSYSRLTDSIIKTDFGIILKMYISIDIPTDYKQEELIDEINSTVWHELNHLYEFYNRFLNIKGSVINRSVNISLSYSNSNRWKIKNEIFHFWHSEFLYLIYISEPYEMNANVQECAYFINKYGFDYLKKTRIYKETLSLKEFNTDKFISNLKDKILEFYEEDKVDYVINRLKMMFVSEYEKNINKYKEETIYDLEKMKKMNYIDFIKIFEKRFNKSGDKVYKKLIKLSAF